MSRGKSLFILFSAVLVVVLVLVGMAIQRHIDTAAEHDLRTPAAASAEHPSTSDDAALADFYVGGHVLRPGFVSLPGTPQPTLRQALDAAGGVASTATPDATTVQLIRRVGDTTDTQSVSLTDLLADQHNPPLEPGDVINVLKRIDAATLPISEKILPIEPRN